MDKVYEDSKRWLEREIQEIIQKGNMATSEDVKVMSMLIDNLKDISIIEAMEEEGYSERYDSDVSYARGRGYHRDSKGRYTRYGSYDVVPYDNYRTYDNRYMGTDHEDMRR